MKNTLKRNSARTRNRRSKQPATPTQRGGWHRQNHPTSTPTSLKAATATRWFRNTFLPFLTNECVHSAHQPDEIIHHMQTFWNAHTRAHNLTPTDAKRLLREYASCNTDNTEYKVYRYNTPSRWSAPRSEAPLVGGGAQTGQSMGCALSTNYTPHNYDAYDKWRGNAGGSIPTGATIPQNPFQRISNWFSGHTTVFNPGTQNPTVQNQVRYMSRAPAQPIKIGSLQNPANVNMYEGMPTNRGIVMPGVIRSNKMVQVFPDTKGFTPPHHHQYKSTPMARAGKRRRAYTRSRRTRR